MSHCAPEATLKPKRFKFTPKAILINVFVVTCGAQANSAFHPSEVGKSVAVNTSILRIVSRCRRKLQGGDHSAGRRGIVDGGKSGPCPSMKRRWGAHLPFGGGEPLGG